MSVVVDRFEILPDPQPAQQPTAPAAPATPTSGQQLMRQIEATLRTLETRRARLRAN
jgi:hypothetical protein